ncbi:MAG: flagellar hook assembly protein FlgD, partial [Candidatus Krumholzibacteriia bacterium]
SVTAVGDTPGAGSFALFGAAPNPFNPMTTIAFNLPRSETVNLRVYDISGRVVRSLLVGETANAGRNEVVWNGRDDSERAVASGVYFYRLETSRDQAHGRMTLVK